MTTFRTYLAIVRAHWVYLAIYLVLLASMAVFTGMAVAGSDTSGDSFAATAPKVAVIDRDGSALSRALAAHALDGNEQVGLADDRRAIQDALARDRVAYLLVIPEGWGQGVLDAARDGTDAPALETSVSYRSGEARLVDVEVSSYANALYGFAATLGGSGQDVVDAADAAWSEDVETSMVSVPEETTPLPAALTQSVLMSAYSVFATATTCIAVLMTSVNARPVRLRRLAAPVSARREGGALLGACVVVALLAWAVNFGLELALFGGTALASSPVQVALVGAALLVYALVSAAVGWLVGRLGASETVANAVANVLGMVFSLLCGAWTDLSLLPDSLIAVAHATPAWWMAQVVSGAASMTSVSARTVGPLLGDLGVCALFGVACLAVGTLAGRRRS